MWSPRAFVYYRFRKPNYTVEERRAMVARIGEHLAAGRDVFAYFKHEETPEGALYAVELLREVRGPERSMICYSLVCSRVLVDYSVAAPQISTACSVARILRRVAVHVFVALADNEHQGIVPVPARLGNGDDPDHNLYWGSAYGVKTFFARSVEWSLIELQRKTEA